ncbi:MAG: long-chain fatty acid--CoA ligase, partial [Clostridiaceae bacterium]|nr:long-chain fatty acid--CoA ligase [Clostridiaceae bacterium]
FVIITGRKKNVIVTKNGKNIFPEELEALLTRNPEIAEAVVSGEEEKDGDTRIVVEIFPDMEEMKTALGTPSPTEEEVKALLQTKVNEVNKVVSSYKAIRRVTVRNEPFAKNTTQKIKRDYSKKVAVNNE